MGMVQCCCETERTKQLINIDEKLANQEFAFPNGYNEEETIKYFIRNWNLKSTQEESMEQQNTRIQKKLKIQDRLDANSKKIEMMSNLDDYRTPKISQLSLQNEVTGGLLLQKYRGSSINVADPQLKKQVSRKILRRQSSLLTFNQRKKSSTKITGTFGYHAKNELSYTPQSTNKLQQYRGSFSQFANVATRAQNEKRDESANCSFSSNSEQKQKQLDEDDRENLELLQDLQIQVNKISGEV